LTAQNLGEAVPLTVRQVYYRLRRMDRRVAELLVERYAGSREAVKAIEASGLLDLAKLASLIIWLAGPLSLRVDGLGLVVDVETGEPQFIAVYIGDCGWDEWKVISRTVKEHLVGEGFSDIAGRVALVCSRAFETPRS
jgi:hypothetical protein